MGCLLAIIVRSVLAFRYFPKTIWVGIGVGAAVGVIIALAKGDWVLLAYGCLCGLAGGIIFELIIRLISRIDSRRAR